MKEKTMTVLEAELRQVIADYKAYLNTGERRSTWATADVDGSLGGKVEWICFGHEAAKPLHELDNRLVRAAESARAQPLLRPAVEALFIPAGSDGKPPAAMWPPHPGGFMYMRSAAMLDALDRALARLPSPEMLLPTHGPDFRDVSWRGTKYVFAPEQAACIRVLWEAWEQGNPLVADGTVLQKAGVGDKQRLRDVFKNHAAWGKMIVKGPQQDFHGLQEIPEKI